MNEQQCRICGRGLETRTPYWPDPLLPGDIPKKSEMCSGCQELSDRAWRWALTTVNRIKGRADA